MLHTLLRLDRNEKFAQPWFRALEVWSEIDEILESDTFGACTPLTPIADLIIEAPLSRDPLQMAITAQSLNTRFTSCFFLVFTMSRSPRRYRMLRDSFLRHHISTRRPWHRHNTRSRNYP